MLDVYTLLINFEAGVFTELFSHTFELNYDKLISTTIEGQSGSTK